MEELTISITSVDEDWDLLKQLGHKTMERHHPITLEEEVTVDIKVAALVAGNLRTKRLHDILPVEVLLDPVQLVVAEVAILALRAHIIWIHACALVWADESIVAS